MTVPSEYQRARDDFYAFLTDVRDTADVWSCNVSYTMAQGVLQAFRSRISVKEAIAFANILPACLRALFVADWDVEQLQKPFASREVMTREVKSLRAEHNFATDTAIEDVAKALRKHVNERELDKLLATFSEEAAAFWKVS